MRTHMESVQDAKRCGTAFRTYLSMLYADGRQWRRRPGGGSSLAGWQASTREGLGALLGLDRLRKVAAGTPLGIRRQVMGQTNACRVERVCYDVLPGVTVPATMLVPPSEEPLPAIVCPPGHGRGAAQLLDEEDETYKGYPVALARRGFVALVPENLGFGERADPENESTHAFYDRALRLLGQPVLGVMVHDLMRAVEVLASLPEVDGGAIGCWGMSLGGELTLLLAGLDLRIRAAAVSGFFSSYASSFLLQPHCGCGYAPGLARYVEHADLGALIAPRSLWVEIGDTDELFPYTATEASVRELSVAYAMAGAFTAGLTYHLFPGGHEVSGKAAVDWFARTL